MKSLYLLTQVLILSIYCSSFPQEQLFEEEITLYVEGFTSSPTVTYTLEALGTVWANSTISTSYNTADEVVSGNAMSGTHYGWRIFWEAAPYDPFAHGFYKLKTNINTNYVYLDFRDCQFANQSYTPWYSSTDFFLKYNGLTDEFSYANSDPPNFTPILAKDVVRIWDIKNGNPVTSCFESFWQNSLVIAKEISQPLQIIWAPNPNQSNISKYYLYRKIDNQSFIKIGEFNNQTFDYKDKSILFTGDGSSTVSYKVTSFNGIESTPSNIASQEYYFEFDWSNGLILTKNGNHPKLVWVPNNTIQNLTGYKIYRKVDDEAFYYMGMVGTNIFTYTDDEVNLNVKESAIQYYVVATNGGQEDPTNTVTAIGDYNPHKENQQGEELSELKYFLSDNYPNPFNPNTSISYSIPENAFVTLKIYDVLGKEVEVLINEQKEPGNYQIDFNASELSSGIYYYTLTAGNFTSTKKMILMK